MPKLNAISLLPTSRWFWFCIKAAERRTAKKSYKKAEGPKAQSQESSMTLGDCDLSQNSGLGGLHEMGRSDVWMPS